MSKKQQSQPALAEGNIAVEDKATNQIERSSTTENLFPELSKEKKKEPVLSQEKIVENKKEDKKEVINSEKEEVKEEPKNEAPLTEEDIFLDDLLTKNKLSPEKVKFRIKVDGKEEELTLSKLREREQLLHHWENVGRDIGKQRKELAEERQRFISERNVKNPATTQDQIRQPSQDSVEDLLLDRLRYVESLAKSLEPMVYQSNRQKLAEDLKRDGFDDLNNYWSKIESHIAQEKDDDKVRFYDTEEGVKSLYFFLKSKELNEKLNSKKEPPSQPKEEKQPPRQEPPIVRIPSSEETSSVISDDDINGKMRDLLGKYRETRDSKILREIMRLKGLIQGE